MKCTVCERSGGRGIYTPHPSTKGQEKIGSSDFVWVCSKCYGLARTTALDNAPVDVSIDFDDETNVVLHAMLALKLGYAV